MKKELVIEWKHVGRDIENTCERCGATGRTAIDVVEQVRPILEEERSRSGLSRPSLRTRR